MEFISYLSVQGLGIFLAFSAPVTLYLKVRKISFYLSQGEITAAMVVASVRDNSTGIARPVVAGRPTRRSGLRKEK